MTTTTFLFANNAKSTLASAITDAATSLTLASGAGSLFPSPGVDQAFTLTLTDAATGETYEIMYCTARTGDVCTVVRAQEGTTALNWAAGDFANNFLTAGTAQLFPQVAAPLGTMATQNDNSVAITGGSIAADLAGSTTDGTHSLMPDVFTSKGDLVGGGSSGAPGRLAVGSDGQALVADSTQALGLKWSAVLTSPMTTKGDMIAGGTAGAPTRVAVGSDGQVLTADSTQPNGVKWAPGGGGGSLPGAAYMAMQCALLEPDAIEPLQTDTFSYVVATQTKYVTASWQTQIGGAGRSEVRDVSGPMAVNSLTYSGSGSGSCAVIIDPSIPIYSDPWTTYFDRKTLIDTSPVKTVNVSGGGAHAPFLPGAYGAIVTQVTCFDLCWIIWRIAGTWGPNFANEISDSSTDRLSTRLSLAISKRVAGEIETSPVGSGSGSVSYILIPSTWSVIPDPIGSYIFRDDFMEPALDTSVWTIGQSVAGNVGINTTYQWCKVFGTGAWDGNGLHTTASFARAEGLRFLVDVFMPRDASTGWGCVGWSLGGAIGSGYSNNNFAHALNFAGGGIVNVYEDGILRGTVGSGWTPGGIYRVRITLHGGGGATYEMQGGKEYPAIGGPTWSNVTPGTSASANNTLYPGSVAYGGSAYISDVRVY